MPVPPRLAYQSRLIARSLDVLGRKWALLIVRDVAFLGLHRFGQIQRNNPGLTPRVLSRRLQELQEEGILERRTDAAGPAYQATAKGQDALFILFAILRYGLRHHADGAGAPAGGADVDPPACAIPQDAPHPP